MRGRHAAPDAPVDSTCYNRTFDDFRFVRRLTVLIAVGAAAATLASSAASRGTDDDLRLAALERATEKLASLDIPIGHVERLTCDRMPDPAKSGFAVACEFVVRHSDTPEFLSTFWLCGNIDGDGAFVDSNCWPGRIGTPTVILPKRRG